MKSFKQFRQYLSEARDTSAGKQWHKDHPVDYMNIVNHHDQATKVEHRAGRNWYRDAQNFAQTVSRSTKMPVHAIAGLTSVYSPQTAWHDNMIVAARVARHGKTVGGKEQKPYYRYGKSFADNQQRKAAERIINGEHYENVIKGFKTKAFARLIEHGGDKDPNNPEVVVDRHAHSVASGARITDAAFSVSGLKGKKKYDSVKKAYIQAADHINARTGAKIGDKHYLHPHQLQAITWLVRQRLNNEQDIASGKKDSKAVVKAAKSREKAQQKWRNYSGTWHPGVSHLFEDEDNE